MLSMIVATDLDGAIGNKGDMIYHISEDLKRFKKLTTGHPVVMGRKTFESLPNQQPLKDRTNIVITRTPTIFLEQHKEKDVHAFSSVESLLRFIDTFPDEEIFIMGGAEIYKQFMPYVDKIYLTKIYDNSKEADTFINIPFDKFEMVYRGEATIDRNIWMEYKFIDYIRK